VPPELGVAEGNGETGLLSQLDTVAEPLVIGEKSHKPPRDGAVGPMTLARAGEGSVELYFRAVRLAAYEAAGEQADPAGAGRVGRRRPHHDWSDDVQQRNH